VPSMGGAWVFTRCFVFSTQTATTLVDTLSLHDALPISDGNPAVVGGPGDNCGGPEGSAIGAAWVFTRSGTVWTQQGNKLVGTGAVGSAAQVLSVSLSGDGTTAILGGPADNSIARAA